jgi:hypothetical protein
MHRVEHELRLYIPEQGTDTTVHACPLAPRFGLRIRVKRLRALRKRIMHTALCRAKRKKENYVRIMQSANIAGGESHAGEEKSR